MDSQCSHEHTASSNTGFMVGTHDVGTHISKDSGGFLSSLVNFYSGDSGASGGSDGTIKIGISFKTPVQIFTGSPKAYKRPTRNSTDEEETKKYVNANGINLFIHSMYIINLARSDIAIQLAALQYDLDVGNVIGAKGVVVHVGKYLKMSTAEAIENMEKNMKKLTIHDGCPLLLETPAGQGTETLTTVETFVDFMTKFKGNPNYGVCIDTCHVFACNYEPIDYINKFKELWGKFPELIHFNDSKEGKGSKKDRHAAIGTGHIKTIMEVIDIDVPKVME